MSDFRNVLKAGLMVSASLLAVGCSDDNKENTNTGSPSTGSPSTGGGTVAPQPFAAVDPVKVIQGLESEKIALAQIDATAKPVNDILDMSKALHLKGETGSDAAKVAAAVAVIDPQEKVTYAFGDGQRLKGVISGAKDKTHHGKFTANKTLTTDLVFMEHATVAATGGDATWTVKTAHIGDDVVVGSDDIAQKKTSNSTKKLELSGGKKTTKHTSSKLHDHKASAKKTVKTKPEAHKAGKLTLKTAAVTAAEETQFDKAGMAAYGTLGSVELGAALVHDLELDNAVLTAVAPASGFLVLEPDQDKDTEHLTHHKAGSSTASKHPKGEKRKLALEGGKSKPKTSKSKKHPQAKSMHDNKVAEKKKTVGTTAQTLVDQGTGKEHHFMFQMDPKEKHAEVSDLKVGQNAQIQLLKNHPLVVHDINMNGNNLGLRVFAEKGDFHAVKDKAIAWTDVTAVDAADRWKADGKGQALIDKMKTSVEFKSLSS